MRANMYVYLKGAIDAENRFHKCVRELEKAPLVLLSTEGTRRNMNEETELNNTVNKTHIEFNDFIYSGSDTVSLRTDEK